jgi:hypothetical protein
VEIVEGRIIWTKQMAKKNRRRSYPKSQPRVAGDGEGFEEGQEEVWMRIWTERRAEGREKKTKRVKANHPKIKINTLSCLRLERITVLLSY